LAKKCPLVVVGIVSKSMTIWEKVCSSIIGRACGWGCETTKKIRSPDWNNKENANSDLTIHQATCSIDSLWKTIAKHEDFSTYTY
jgi:ribosomal protein L37E